MDFFVRKAKVEHDKLICPLLASSLGYSNTPKTLRNAIIAIIKNPDADILFARTTNGVVVGVLALHFIRGLGFVEDVARIGFVVVGETYCGAGIERLLESQAAELSCQEGCDRMVLPEFHY
jgi:hypothetical protein